MTEASAQPLVLATRSAGKIRELRALCAAAGFETATLDDCGIAESSSEDGIEVYETFAGNAEAKARYFAALLPGRLVLAEDSGLSVDALGGRPGVHSKRWANSTLSGAALDAENNAALLRALEHSDDRRARYVCVAVCIAADGRRWQGEGEVHGRITREARGSGGFGYDPYFESDELGCTFGEASAEAKAGVSHRGRALRALLAAMTSVTAGGAAERRV